jgi:hypothetical protein
MIVWFRRTEPARSASVRVVRADAEARNAGHASEQLREEHAQWCF